MNVVTLVILWTCVILLSRFIYGEMKEVIMNRDRDEVAAAMGLVALVVVLAAILGLNGIDEMIREGEIVWW